MEEGELSSIDGQNWTCGIRLSGSRNAGSSRCLFRDPPLAAARRGGTTSRGAKCMQSEQGWLLFELSRVSNSTRQISPVVGRQKIRGLVASSDFLRGGKVSLP